LELKNAAVIDRWSLLKGNDQNRIVLISGFAKKIENTAKHGY
jgi:hypothetical protein